MFNLFGFFFSKNKFSTIQTLVWAFELGDSNSHAPPCHLKFLKLSMKLFKINTIVSTTPYGQPGTFSPPINFSSASVINKNII